MKILITGVSGMLGQELYQYFKDSHEVLGLDLNNKFENKNWCYCDLTKNKQVMKVTNEFNPDVIIHCAAWTDVNKADMYINKEKVYQLNVTATKYLAKAASACNAKLVYISTDYVFDGKKTDGYLSSDKPNPLNYYGKTKFLGEKAAQKYCSSTFVCRISWLYGKYGENFISKMTKKILSSNDPIYMVNDQVGRLTYTYDLAVMLQTLITTDKFGIWNVSNGGKFLNRCELVNYLKEYLKSNIEVIPTKTSQENIKRPLNSAFDLEALIKNNLQLPNWQKSLDSFLKSYLLELK